MNATINRKPWTILVYAAADSKLHRSIYQKLDDLEEIVTDQVDFIAQLDQPGNQGARRYRLQPDGIAGRITSPELGRRGVTDMASPSVLADFIAWGMTNYPAQHTALVICGESHGWRGLIKDDYFNTQLSLPQLESALQRAQTETGQKLSVLALDTNGAGSAEVAYQLRDQADYLVASEAPLTPRGLPLAHLLRDAVNQPLPDQFCRSVVQAATTSDLATLAAFQLNQLPAVAIALRGFSDKLLRLESPYSLTDSWERSRSFHNAIDLADLATQIENDHWLREPGLQTAGHRLQHCIDKANLSNHAAPDRSGAHGLTIQVQGNRTDYDDLALCRDTDWHLARAVLQKALP